MAAVVRRASRPRVSRSSIALGLLLPSSSSSSIAAGRETRGMYLDETPGDVISSGASRDTRAARRTHIHARMLRARAHTRNVSARVPLREETVLVGHTAQWTEGSRSELFLIFFVLRPDATSCRTKKTPAGEGESEEPGIRRVRREGKRGEREREKLSVTTRRVTWTAQGDRDVAGRGRSVGDGRRGGL